MRDWKPRDLAQSFQLMLLDGSTVRLHGKARSFKEDRITLWSLKSGAMEVRSSDQASFERRVAPDCWLTKPGSTLKVSSLSTYHSIGLVLVGDAPMSLEERLKKDMPQALSQQIESWSLRWWRSPSEYLKVNAEFNLWYCQGLEDEAWGPGDDPFMDALRASIRALLTHGPTAQGVAQTMGMSRAQLYRQLSLKKSTVLEIIDEEKMLESERLLSKPEVRVGGVARMCGFSSSAIFSRWFKIRCGLTPTAWRKKHIPGFRVGSMQGQSRRSLGQWERSRRYP